MRTRLFKSAVLLQPVDNNVPYGFSSVTVWNLPYAAPTTKFLELFIGPYDSITLPL